MNRRDFFLTAAAAGSVPLFGASGTRLGLVRSNHTRLARPAPLDDPLSYEQVRDMVFRAISLAGGPERQIKPGSWVVIKPNIVALRPRPSYRTGDITDFRVTRAVVEYVARHSRAGRITVAEGGSYRSTSDPATDSAVLQGGRRVSAYEFDWGTDEFPGFDGSLRTMLERARRTFPDKHFDYIDLSYDAVRDPSGAFRRIEVPRAPTGAGAFGGRPDYFVTNTILNCDFLITVPVMKVHNECGITASLKNYVGTAPREAYGAPGIFSNTGLHSQHSAGGRIDPFIVDLAAFHPPDYCVVDGIRGLQSSEHSNHRPDQMIQSNLVFAGRDPVAADALAARLTGFDPHDMEFLHMAAARGMGTMDFRRIDVRGDEPDRYQRTWEKPRRWYGRCNREWTVLVDGAPRRYTAPFDTLDLPAAAGSRSAAYAALTEVESAGHRDGFLWIGLRGALTAKVNGETVAEFNSATRYRVGQFQYPVALRPGRNRLEFEVRPVNGEALLSALLTGPRNDGDTLDGIRWMAA